MNKVTMPKNRPTLLRIIVFVTCYLLLHIQRIGTFYYDIKLSARLIQ